MTENRRIVLNVCATYGRSLFALLCGLITGRWVLLSLGEVDYGLYGLVAGLTAFISFFNSVLGSAIGRFYAISVGAMRSSADKESALRECRVWFNTAVSIHTILPIVLMTIGYPLGCWAIRDYLTIPADRVGDCIWIFRFVCLTCFVGMVSIPFNAMYTAKQYIAELTIYSFITTMVNVVFLYYMITHPGVWLVKYGLWSCALSFVPNMIILIRAMIVFPECRIVRSMLFRVERFRRLGSFACWQLIGMTSGLLRTQGIAILVNKFFGPRVNAAMTIGGTINGHANTLSGSMLGALSPAIVNAYGAGDSERMRRLVFMACRFSVLLSMLFSLPLILEMPKVLELWLKCPPQYASEFAILFLVQLMVENLTVGHMIAVHASGRIALYHVLMGAISLLALPIAYVWLALGGSPTASVLAIILTVMVYTVMRLILAKRIVGLSIRTWILRVSIPIFVASAVSLAFAWLPHMFMVSSFWRIVVTTIFCELILLPMLWFVILDDDEREFVRERFLRRILSKIGLW